MSELNLTQKIECEFAKMFFLAFQINSKTEMCCNAEDWGHVSWITLSVLNNKNGANLEDELRFKFNYELDDNQDKINFAQLQKCNAFLEKILNDEKISAEALSLVDTITVPSYYFLKS